MSPSADEFVSSLSNVTMLWGTLIAEAFYRLGGRYAVISPGSRSAPLTFAFARHKGIATSVILDERSAAFFALGIAKESGIPTALICTSGTAAAHFFPAVIEAGESGVPLLILTADRPPEMRDCQAGQTIDQLKMFGNYPVWQAELAVPEASEAVLEHLRGMVVHAFRRAKDAHGVVHLNVPLREPLYPQVGTLPDFLKNESWFADWVRPIRPPISFTKCIAQADIEKVLNEISGYTKGLIVVGYCSPYDVNDFATQLGQLSERLGWPVVDGGFSGIRSQCDVVPHLITHYEPLLVDDAFAHDMRPECVLQLGALPTGKRLRAWLGMARPQIFLLDVADRNVDTVHRATLVRCSLQDLIACSKPRSNMESSVYTDQWVRADALIAERVDVFMSAEDTLFEGKLSWLLSRSIPADTPVVYANSMPVRDLELFWRKGHGGNRIFVNRGANGIDGTLSTAMGIAVSSGRHTCLVTGDLAFLHDSNGLLNAHKFKGALTVFLINNDGGGIFEHLPVARYEPPFEEFFATPQAVDIEKLCSAYSVSYVRIHNWQEVQVQIEHPPFEGVRIVEITTHRRMDAEKRMRLVRELFSKGWSA